MLFQEQTDHTTLMQIMAVSPSKTGTVSTNEPGAIGCTETWNDHRWLVTCNLWTTWTYPRFYTVLVILRWRGWCGWLVIFWEEESQSLCAAIWRSQCWMYTYENCEHQSKVLIWFSHFCFQQFFVEPPSKASTCTRWRTVPSVICGTLWRRRWIGLLQEEVGKEWKWHISTIGATLIALLQNRSWVYSENELHDALRLGERFEFGQ